MSATGPALLLAAAGVGFGHAVLPDHWVPLAVLGRTRRYPLSRIARLSGLAGVAHVLVSILLGALIIVIGLHFRSAVESAQGVIIGSILIATGLAFALLELTGRGHHHHHAHGHHHEHGHEHNHEHNHETGGHHHEPGDADELGHHHEPGDADELGHHHDLGHLDDVSHSVGHEPPSRLRGVAAVMVPFGAAASPDLTILPVFLAATTAGLATAVGSLVVFAAVTIGTIVGLTLAAARGGYQIRGMWLERWGNVLTAMVLVVIGLGVLTGVI